MQSIISLYVPAVPVPQPRQRHRVVQPKHEKAYASNYTPAKDPVNAYKACVCAAWHEEIQQPEYGDVKTPLVGPLVVNLEFVLPRTGKPSWLQKKTCPRLFADWKRGLRIPHCSNRMDRDNLMKSTLDALNGLAWFDDGQIWDGRETKWIAADREQPHVWIEILQAK